MDEFKEFQVEIKFKNASMEETCPSRVEYGSGHQNGPSS